MRKLLHVIAAAALLTGLAGGAGAGEFQPFVRGSWKQIAAGHAGRPFVVHVWGLTCGPCRVEMPKWGKLLAERSDLDLVLINADLVPDDPAAAFGMLDKSGLAQADNWIFNDGFVERLRYEIDPRWRGELPMTYLIGRDGARTKIEGVADLAKVRDWLAAQGTDRLRVD